MIHDFNVLFYRRMHYLISKTLRNYFICIKKEAIIYFYFFSVTLVAKLILLVLPVDICLLVIYSQLIALQELWSVFHIFNFNKAAGWQESSIEEAPQKLASGFSTFIAG